MTGERGVKLNDMLQPRPKLEPMEGFEINRNRGRSSANVEKRVDFKLAKRAGKVGRDGREGTRKDSENY